MFDSINATIDKLINRNAERDSLRVVNKDQATQIRTLITARDNAQQLAKERAEKIDTLEKSRDAFKEGFDADQKYKVELMEARDRYKSERDDLMAERALIHEKLTAIDFGDEDEDAGDNDEDTNAAGADTAAPDEGAEG